MKIIATMSPKTPELLGIDIIRINGAFGNIDEWKEIIENSNNKPVFIDIPNGRKKLRTSDYSDDEIVGLAKKMGVDYIAISYVNNVGDMKWDYPTIAKIETAQGVENIDTIVKKADKVLIDRRDLVTSIGINNLDEAINRVIESVKANNKEVFVASELLISMLQNNEPTISEAQMISRLTKSGVDGFVLAEETARSNNPQYIVDTLFDLFKK